MTAVVGVGCCAASFVLGVTSEALFDYLPGNGIVWYSRTDTSDTLAEDETKYYSNVREIDVEMVAGNVEVVTYDGDDVIVETENISEKHRFRSFMEEDTLKLETTTPITGIDTSEVGTVYVRIPADMQLAEASMEIVAGRLDVESIDAQELSVEVGTGTAAVKQFHAAQADLSCGTGTLEVSGSVDLELDIENDIGSTRCNITGKQEDYNYEISCGVGTVTVGSNDYSGIGSEKNISGNTNKKMDIECGIGEVTVSFTE